jgi:hypothetical protein
MSGRRRSTSPQWNEEYTRVEAKPDASARKFAEYQKLMAQLVEMFRDAEAVDAEVSRVKGSAPDGEHRRLLGVELTARNLESFSRDNPSITKTAQLPDWQHSGRMVWPPPQPSFAALYAQSMVPQDDPRRYSGRWHEVLEEYNAKRAEIEAARAEEEQKHAAEEREKYFASLRR